jgi:hypothetical protein
MSSGERLCSLIDDLLLILRRGEHDVTWTGYGTIDEVITELEQLRHRIENGDAAAREQLRFRCLPTGAIEEIAISSGWTGTWLKLINDKYRSVFA